MHSSNDDNNNNNNIRGEGEGEENEEEEDALRRVDNCREILEREDSFFSDAAARGASGGATKTSGGSGGGEGKTMVKTKRDAIDALIDMVKENPKRKEAWRELGLAMQLGRGSADSALTRALSERRSDDGEEEKDEEKEKKMKEKKKKKKKNEHIIARVFAHRLQRQRGVHHSGWSLQKSVLSTFCDDDSRFTREDV
mmetsp:Transcript_2853/g.9302  ORF Transcript_2853/g.9302 Transcript_2853/m.9302 type:complete len:197 (+) Transcript_2853:146-736(+)